MCTSSSDPFRIGNCCSRRVPSMSQRRTTTRHPESGHERESRGHALAELQRLSRLAPESSTGREIAPAWVQESLPVQQALSLIDRFRDAGTKVFNPEDYSTRRGGKKESARCQALVEWPGSGTFRRGAHRLHHALCVRAPAHRTDQSTNFKFGLSVEQKKFDLAQFLRDRIMTAFGHASSLGRDGTSFTGYRRTEEALARYIELARTDDRGKLPAVTKPIEPGQSSWVCPVPRSC